MFTAVIRLASIQRPEGGTGTAFPSWPVTSSAGAPWLVGLGTTAVRVLSRSPSGAYCRRDRVPPGDGAPACTFTEGGRRQTSSRPPFGDIGGKGTCPA